PCPGPVRPSFARPTEAQAARVARRFDGPHEGSETEGDPDVRQARAGHGLPRGPDRDADRADQRPHRAPADAREGPLLAARAAQARRAAPPLPELPAADRPGGLPRPHQGARPQAVAPTTTPEGGGLSESRRIRG